MPTITMDRSDGRDCKQTSRIAEFEIEYAIDYDNLFIFIM